MLQQLFGAELGFSMRLVIAVVVIAVLLAITVFVMRRLGGRPGRSIGRGEPRLAIVDAIAIDQRRRLVLVRRDDVEHLVLTGGDNDVVVEKNITGAAEGNRPALPAEHEAPPAMPQGATKPFLAGTSPMREARSLPRHASEPLHFEPNRRATEEPSPLAAALRLRTQPIPDLSALNRPSPQKDRLTARPDAESAEYKPASEGEASHGADTLADGIAAAEKAAAEKAAAEKAAAEKAAAEKAAAEKAAAEKAAAEKAAAEKAAAEKAAAEKAAAEKAAAERAAAERAAAEKALEEQIAAEMAAAFSTREVPPPPQVGASPRPIIWPTSRHEAPRRDIDDTARPTPVETRLQEMAQRLDAALSHSAEDKLHLSLSDLLEDIEGAVAAPPTPPERPQIPLKPRTPMAPPPRIEPTSRIEPPPRVEAVSRPAITMPIHPSRSETPPPVSRDAAPEGFSAPHLTTRSEPASAGWFRTLRRTSDSAPPADAVKTPEVPASPASSGEPAGARTAEPFLSARRPEPEPMSRPPASTTPAAPKDEPGTPETSRDEPAKDDARDFLDDFDAEMANLLGRTPPR